MSPNDRILSFIRTYAAYAVGALATFVAIRTGFIVPDALTLATVTLLAALATTAYYTLVRLAEVRFPILGALLGFPRQPDYPQVDNLWASFVRTLVPTLASVIVALIATGIAALFQFDLTLDHQAELSLVIVFGVQALYYGAARAILARWPRAAWLLGTPVAPTYTQEQAPPAVR